MAFLKILFYLIVLIAVLVLAYYTTRMLGRGMGRTRGTGGMEILDQMALGRDSYLKEIAETVKIPVLRKDFVVEEYQIYEAKVLGAGAVLLICALIEPELLKRYIQVCDTLGLSALVEAHDEKEISHAVWAGARVIGVNNRNLKDFSVDVGNSTKLRALAPKEVLFVAESGIKGPEDIARLKENEVDAVLIGETLMKSRDKKKMLSYLKGEGTSDGQ